MKKQILPEMRKNFFIIEGLSIVNEYYRHKPHAVQFVVAKEKYFTQIKSYLKGAKVPIYLAEQIVETKQSLQSKSPVWAVVEVNTIGETNFFELLNKKNKKTQTIIALDHITDPRNMGAIIRNAAFFGIDFIVAPKDRQVLLTQSCISTSQGACAIVDIVVVTNLARFIEKMKKELFWVVGGCANGQSLKKFNTYFEKKILVFGSEEKGLSQIVRKKCDVVLAIDRGVKSFDSLNVSVATGIMIHALKNE